LIVLPSTVTSLGLFVFTTEWPLSFLRSKDAFAAARPPKVA